MTGRAVHGGTERSDATRDRVHLNITSVSELHTGVVFLLVPDIYITISVVIPVIGIDQARRVAAVARAPAAASSIRRASAAVVASTTRTTIVP
jgi:hypothetical protein